MAEIYQPREDSWLLKKWVKSLAHGKVLDVGTGSGVQAKASEPNADEVTAVDVNEEAVEKVSEENPSMKVFQSDLFREVHGKFDTIIFNPPYLPKDEGVEDDSIYGGKHGYELLLRFLKEAKGHLKEEGILLFVFSSLTKKKRVDEELDKLGYTWLELERKSMNFEKLYAYKAWLE